MPWLFLPFYQIFIFNQVHLIVHSIITQCRVVLILMNILHKTYFVNVICIKTPYVLQKWSIKAGVKALSILYTCLACGDTYAWICLINSFDLLMLSLILSSFALSLIDFFSIIIILSIGSDFNFIIRLFYQFYHRNH